MIELILCGLQWSTCLVYLDGILIFAKTFDDHMSMLKEIFECISQAGLKLHLKKCKFLRKGISYLGHSMSASGITPDPAKVEVVSHFPILQNLTQLRSFLGLVECYKKFIADFAKMAYPLHALLKTNYNFVWTKDCQETFQQLKMAVLTAPILIHPDFNAPFILHTDASGSGLGAVLLQEQDGVDRLIAHASRSLSKAEQNYVIAEQEALAVIWDVKYF